MTGLKIPNCGFLFKSFLSMFRTFLLKVDGFADLW